jgi:ribonuclease HI
MEYIIGTDGSCLDNGKPTARGGWSFIVQDTEYNDVHIDFGKIREGKQTNNRAEQEAVLQALIWVWDNTEAGDSVTIYCDSDVVVGGINGTSGRDANRDIWAQIETMCTTLLHTIKVEGTEGHQNNSEDPIHVLNFRADKLARQGANTLLKAPVIVKF